MKDLTKIKQMAYDLTLETVKENNILKNISKDNVEEQTNYITRIYNDILDTLTKSDIDL